MDRARASMQRVVASRGTLVECEERVERSPSAPEASATVEEENVSFLEDVREG